MNTNKQGVVLDGYDLVSYFEGNPTQGLEEFTAVYNGYSFQFASEAHRNTFLSNPQAYLPKYGGYCAYAMAKSGDLVGVNPKAYEIIDGGLYLFYKAWGTNTLNKWQQGDVKQQVQDADAYWTQIKH